MKKTTSTVEAPQEAPTRPDNTSRIIQLKASAFDLTNEIERLVNIRNQVITELNKELAVNNPVQ